jgi:hypothetical protein
LLKNLSQAAGFGLSIAAMIGTETAHADMPIPCWPCDDQAYMYNMACQDAFGWAWYYCGGGQPWQDYIWCCCSTGPYCDT